MTTKEEEDAEVGANIADDWCQDVYENTLEQIEETIKALGMQLATLVEAFHGDDNVMRLAEVFRETGDAIDTRLGEYIRKDRERARILAKRREQQAREMTT